MVATLAAWGFCLMWAFSIGYFSRYSPVFMFFERESYDKMRMHDFERRMGSVNPQMSEILRSHLRFNDASEIPVQHRRCFAFMSMNRSYPYLDHGIVSLAKALRISEEFYSSPSTITGAVVSVFIAGNDTSHADHLKALNVRVNLISETFDSLAPLSAILHSEITKTWNTMHYIRRMKMEYAAILLHLSAQCHSFVVMEDDAFALPVLPNNVPFASAFSHAESALMSSAAPYVKLFSTSRYYRFGFYDISSYFILGAIGIAFAVILQVALEPFLKLRKLKLFSSQRLLISGVSVAVGVICAVWISRPVLFPLQTGVVESPDSCCSQAHLYAGANSSVTKRIAEGLLDSVDRGDMYDISIAQLAYYGKITQMQLVHRPSLFGHAGVASSKSASRTNFIYHIEE